jgi:hypothetical protein
MGLPTKESQQNPIFDYQKIKNDALQIPDLYNSLKQNFKHIHLWVKTGLGLLADI